MQVKFFAFVILAFFVTGCSNTFGPEPEKPKNKDIKVVEKIEEESKKNETVVATVEDAPVKESKAAAKNPALKPEPFSLESNEEDPELLGPQSTLKGGLLNKLEGKKPPKGEEKLQKKEEKI